MHTNTPLCVYIPIGKARRPFRATTCMKENCLKKGVSFSLIFCLRKFMAMCYTDHTIEKVMPNAYHMAITPVDAVKRRR